MPGHPVRGEPCAVQSLRLISASPWSVTVAGLACDRYWANPAGFGGDLGGIGTDIVVLLLLLTIRRPIGMLAQHQGVRRHGSLGGSTSVSPTYQTQRRTKSEDTLSWLIVLCSCKYPLLQPMICVKCGIWMFQGPRQMRAASFRPWRLRNGPDGGVPCFQNIARCSSSVDSMRVTRSVYPRTSGYARVEPERPGR